MSRKKTYAIFDITVSNIMNIQGDNIVYVEKKDDDIKTLQVMTNGVLRIYYFINNQALLVNFPGRDMRLDYLVLNKGDKKIIYFHTIEKKENTKKHLHLITKKV